MSKSEVTERESDATEGEMAQDLKEHLLPVVREVPPWEEEGASPPEEEGPAGVRWGFDLNAHPVTRFLLTNRYVQPTLQLLTLGVFGWAVWQAFTGPADPESNFGAVAFFGLWWAPFMIISLMLVGRVWCYFCPIGAITQFLQRFSLDLRFPTFWKPKWKVFGLGLSVLSLAGVSFILARFPLYKFGVAAIPERMGVYFLVFLGIAVLLTFIFRQRVFCRYFCPATGVMSVTTRLSPIEIRQDRDSRVPDCMTAEFKSNYLSTERRCVACMNCTTEQPEQSVRFQLRWPGAAAVRQRLLIPDEALIALVIWAVFPIDHVLGSRVLAESAWVQAMPTLLAESFPYLASIAATILAFALVSRVSAAWSGLDPREAFVRFAFAYVPLGIMFQLGRHVIPGLMENGGGLLNAFAGGLGIPLSVPVAWADPATVEAWTAFSAGGWLWLSVLWGVGIAWFVANGLAEDAAGAIKAVVPHVLLMIVSTGMVVGFLG
ncbi:MAG: 4Fe-4S binding protein [Gemmatimonadota bacterium]